jgi:glutamate synthase (ferredoxin)
MVSLEEVTTEDLPELRQLIENHHRATRSTVAERILADWQATLNRFVKVIPVDYKRALKRMAAEKPGRHPLSGANKSREKVA